MWSHPGRAATACVDALRFRAVEDGTGVEASSRLDKRYAVSERATHGAGLTLH